MTFGISVALLTPFTERGDLDTDRLGAHALEVLGRGAQGVTLFGTTGEGASIAYGERANGIEALLSAGVPSETVTLGICACALDDALRQTIEGVEQGIEQFLLLPPFYFKGCEDDGLFDWHMQLAAATPATSRFILYHIPQVSGVPLSRDLVCRLAEAKPERFVAIKDSAGAWDNTERLIRTGALDVLVGDERYLARALQLGAKGSICGTANLFPERLARLFSSHAEDAELNRRVDAIVARPIIPALKAMLAQKTGVSAWNTVRRPFLPLSDNAFVQEALGWVD
jgi:4-hydroxy-tetrahydrodipicolinate synthase